MIVTTISKSHIKSVSLPEKVKGQFWLYETSMMWTNDRLVLRA